MNDFLVNSVHICSDEMPMIQPLIDKKQQDMNLIKINKKISSTVLMGLEIPNNVISVRMVMKRLPQPNSTTLFKKI